LPRFGPSGFKNASKSIDDDETPGAFPEALSMVAAFDWGESRWLRAWSEVWKLDWEVGDEVVDVDDCPELPEEVIPPNARPIFSTARFASPAAGAKLLVKLVVAWRDDEGIPWR
jgi:hypothetical protein